MQIGSSLLIILVVSYILCLDYKALLDLTKYWSESWRSNSLKVVSWCVDGELAS